jgi:hypothetical protein
MNPAQEKVFVANVSIIIEKWENFPPAFSLLR